MSFCLPFLFNSFASDRQFSLEKEDTGDAACDPMVALESRRPVVYPDTT